MPTVMRSPSVSVAASTRWPLTRVPLVEPRSCSSTRSSHDAELGVPARDPGVGQLHFGLCAATDDGAGAERDGALSLEQLRAAGAPRHRRPGRRGDVTGDDRAQHPEGAGAQFVDLGERHRDRPDERPALLGAASATMVAELLAQGLVVLLEALGVGARVRRRRRWGRAPGRPRRWPSCSRPRG